MQPYRCFQAGSKLRHTLHALFRSRVLRVDARNKTGKWTKLIDHMIIFLHLFHTAHKIIESTGEYRTESTVRRRFCNAAWKIVHIKIARDAAGQILHDSKHRQIIHVFRRKLCLLREYLFI